METGPEILKNLSQNGESQEPLSAIIRNVVIDLQTLCRQEIALAKTEIYTEWKNGKRAVYTLVIAAGCGVLGAVFVAVAMAQVLIEWGIISWAAYLVVGLVLMAGALQLHSHGKELVKGVDLMPGETIQSIRENVKWIKTRR